MPWVKADQATTFRRRAGGCFSPELERDAATEIAGRRRPLSGGDLMSAAGAGRKRYSALPFLRIEAALEQLSGRDLLVMLGSALPQTSTGQNEMGRQLGPDRLRDPVTEAWQVDTGEE